MTRKDTVFRSLSAQIEDLQELLAIGVDMNGNFRYFSSFDDPAYDIYALECSKTSIIYNEQYNPEDPKDVN